MYCGTVTPVSSFLYREAVTVTNRDIDSDAVTDLKALTLPPPDPGVSA